MNTGDLQKAVQGLAPDIPVLFYSKNACPAEEYLEGQAVRLSRCWDCKTGWQPCLLLDVEREE